MSKPLESNIDWMKSRQRRAFEIGLIGAATPLLASAALLATGVIANCRGRDAVLTTTERSLYPGNIFEVRKIGDPESDDPLFKLCRQSMFDELPQTIDIIRGDMSVFGPRADKPEHIQELFAAIEDDELRSKWQDARAQQKPGVLSSYSIGSHGRNLSGDPEYVRFGDISGRSANALERARLDIYDFENASFSHDLSLLRSAVRMVTKNYKQYLHR